MGSVCRECWLQPAISSNISTAVPQCIKAGKNQHKIKFLEWLRPKFAECRALSLVTTPTQEHTSKNWCSLLFLNESQAPRGCSVDGSFWIAWWSQDMEQTLPKVGNALAQLTEQEGTRKAFEKREEGCKAVLHTQLRDNGIALNAEGSLGILFSWDHGLRSHHCPRSPPTTEPVKEHNSPDSLQKSVC